MKQGILIAAFALTLQACSPATADSVVPQHDGHDHHECKCETKLTAPKYYPQAGCVKATELSQGEFIFDGKRQVRCVEISHTCVCPQH